MKIHRCWLLLVLVMGIGNGAFGATDSAFEEANAKYRAGDFKGAAQGYDAVIQSGQGTAAVSYNLGNALLRSGKKARALLAYERALAADPRNRDLRWNINVVQSALTDRLEDSAPAWLETLRRMVGWVSINETAWVLLALAGTLALAGWLGFALGARAAWMGSLQGFLFAMALLTSGVFGFQSREEGRSRAVVTDPEVTLRYGPAFSETKAFVLHEGAAAEILDESGDWWYAQYGNNAGWLPKKSCEVI